MSSSYNISNRRTKVIESTINNNLQNKYGFIDTLKSLRGLKKLLKSGTIDKSQFLLHIREIKKQSEEINVLFKPTHEFNYWFTGSNYRANRMAKIIEHLEDTYPTLFQGEQSISSNIKDINFHLNIDLMDKASAKDQSYVSNNTASRIDEPNPLPIPSASDQENLDVSSIADKVSQINDLPDRVVGSSRDNDNLENLIGQLEVWVNEAADVEKEARSTAKSRILEAYNKNSNGLDLSWLSLTMLPMGVFNHLTTLKTLNLSHNRLMVLPDGVFNGLTKLQSLSLSYNSLSKLPAGVFNGLTKLQYLYLSGNQLSKLLAGVFNGLTELQSLSLSYNSLSELRAGVFNELTKLELLNLSNNQLSELPAGIFNELTKLELLNLSNNQLSELPAGVFNGLTELSKIQLNNNRFNIETINQIEN